MKRTTLEEWESKYIVGEVKYTQGTSWKTSPLNR
jgi:hypothetical protein